MISVGLTKDGVLSTEPTWFVLLPLTQTDKQKWIQHKLPSWSALAEAACLRTSIHSGNLRSFWHWMFKEWFHLHCIEFVWHKCACVKIIPRTRNICVQHSRKWQKSNAKAQFWSTLWHDQNVDPNSIWSDDACCSFLISLIFHDWWFSNATQC